MRDAKGIEAAANSWTTWAGIVTGGMCLACGPGATLIRSGGLSSWQSWNASFGLTKGRASHSIPPDPS